MLKRFDHVNPFGVHLKKVHQVRVCVSLSVCVCVCVCAPISNACSKGSEARVCIRASARGRPETKALVSQAGPTADKDAEGEDMSSLHAVQGAALMQTPEETSLAPGGVDAVCEAGDAVPASMEASGANVETAAGTQAAPSAVDRAMPAHTVSGTACGI